jgi:hypothetical protein
MGNKCSDCYDNTCIPDRTRVWRSHPNAVAFYERVSCDGLTFCCGCWFPGGFGRNNPVGLRGEAKLKYAKEKKKYDRSPARRIVEASLNYTHVKGCRADPTCGGDYLFTMANVLNLGDGWAHEVNREIQQYSYRVRAEAWDELYHTDAGSSKSMRFLGVFVDKVTAQVVTEKKK